VSIIPEGSEYAAGNGIVLNLGVAIPGLDSDRDVALFNQPAQKIGYSNQTASVIGSTTTFFGTEDDKNFLNRILFLYALGTISKRLMGGWGEGSSQYLGAIKQGTFTASFDYSAGFVVTNWRT